MKNYFLRFSIFFLILPLIYSCSGITITGNKKEFVNYDSIAFIQLVVSPPYVPAIPLIDASIYNNAVEEIVPDILEVNKKKANEFAEYTSNYFKDSTTMIAFSGSEYFTSEIYKSLITIVDTFGIELEDDDFFEMAIPDGSYNFYKVYEDYPLEYLDDLSALDVKSKKIGKIANHLDKELVAIAITGNIPIDAGFFTSNWGTINRTKFFFFRRDGSLILYADIDSKNIRVKGGSLNGYKFMLDFYKRALRVLAEELNINKYK